MRIANFILHTVHLGVIFFNLFGWVFPAARRANLVLLLLTGFSWFVLGLCYGIGYCPLTEWHWHVREALGERNLPNSYVTDLLVRWLGITPNPLTVDIVVAGSYFTALGISIRLNLRKANQVTAAPDRVK